MIQEEAMAIIPIRVNDKLRLKKAHPCGGYVFSVLRVGADVRVKCETCGRDMTIDRIKLEKAIKSFIKEDEVAKDSAATSERNHS